MTIRASFPSLRPSLDLHFARTKRLDPRVTFSRDDSQGRATYFDAGGVLRTAAIGAPRFDHNPSTGESLGLLVEEARTNLLLQSNQFDTTWTNTNSSDLAAQGISPDGSSNAWSLADNSTNGPHNLAQAVAFSAVATTYTVFVKYVNHQWVYLRMGPASDLKIGAFDVLNGIVGNVTAGATGSVQRYSNGWLRLTLSSTLSATGTASALIGLSDSNIASAREYIGSGTTVLIYGAQLEQGAFPTSYIKTEAATATRAADIAQITGTSFSSWYRQSEGTFYGSVFAPKGTVLYGTGNTFDNTQYVANGLTNNVSIRSGGTSYANLTAGISTTNTTKIAHTYKADDFAATSNGGTVSTDASGAVPVEQIRLKLGASAWDAGGTNNINGHISRLTYWPQRLPDATLQALTR